MPAGLHKVGPNGCEVEFLAGAPSPQRTFRADHVLPRCCRGVPTGPDQGGPEAVHPRRCTAMDAGSRGLSATANARRTTGTSAQACPDESSGPVVRHRGGTRRTGNVLRLIVAGACNRRPDRKSGIEKWPRRIGAVAATDTCAGVLRQMPAGLHMGSEPVRACEVRFLAGVSRHRGGRQTRRPKKSCALLLAQHSSGAGPGRPGQDSAGATRRP